MLVSVPMSARFVHGALRGNCWGSARIVMENWSLGPGGQQNVW
jgi:hypothetical protein